MYMLYHIFQQITYLYIYIYMGWTITNYIYIYIYIISGGMLLCRTIFRLSKKLELDYDRYMYKSRLSYFYESPMICDAHRMG